ncbi:MAG: 23S rRNA (uracil(1939)-C(5))-methyltransferase RlmD [Candidatus Gracilibacteria bacterium]|nr:23S rRNA (uracil(1939)-C(5))-methyltransferase RlmD [Candidatus Gracilibacteria bacterium]
MKRGEILENITIEKLVFGGQGFSKHKDGRIIFVTGGVVPGSIVNLRVLKSKKDYLETQVLDIVKKSPIEKIHPNNPYGINGGCKRVNIPYEEQLKIKENQVKEAFFHIERIIGKKINVSQIIPSPLIDGYRNKVEFSFGKYISAKEQREEHFNLGFHKQGEFSKIEDINGFILIPENINDIFRKIKDFSKSTTLPAYDQKTHEGFFRHLVIRNSFFTNEIMIILSYNHKFNEGKYDIENIKNFLVDLAKNNEKIKSIYLSKNDSLADISIGELELLYSKEYIVEEILGLKFNISPKSFFQTNSFGAEKLYSTVRNLTGKDADNSIILDLYAGTGTIGMILSKNAKKVYSVELVKQASEDGEKNAKNNQIENIEFINAKVEDFLKEYTKNGEKANLLIIDPPRNGMHPDALPNILKFNSKTIIYVSCNPSTLARDLEYILKNSPYNIKEIIPVDMFPHTHHIETIVKLEL